MTGAETYRGKGLIVDPIHGYLLYTRADGLIRGRGDRAGPDRHALGAAAPADPPAPVGALGVPDRRAQPLPARARRDARRRPLRPAALAVPQGGLPRRPLGPARRGAPPRGRAPPRRGPRPVRALLRRQLPGRHRPHPRAGRPADHPRGAGRRRSAGSAGARTASFAAGEAIDPEWICYLMGKTLHAAGRRAIPRWLAFLKPVLSGIYTADNLDYVLRDAHMCGVAVGADLDRIIYYSFFTPEGLTLDRSGTQALIMFLTARFYMYTNVYYHRTTRAIDLHLKEIFRPTMRIVFPWDLRKDLHPLPPPHGVDAPRGGRALARRGRRRAAGPRPGVAADARPPDPVADGPRGGPRRLRDHGLGRHAAGVRGEPRSGRRSRRRSGASSSRSTSRSRTRGR